MRNETMDTITITLMLVIITLMIVICKNFENSYSIKAKVYKVQGNEITFEDVTGETWKYKREGKESYSIDEEVKLFFNDNNTDVRYDDEIVKIKKI